MKTIKQMKHSMKDLRQDHHPNKKMTLKSRSNISKIQKLKKQRTFYLLAKSKLMRSVNITLQERLRNQNKNHHPRAEMEDSSLDNSGNPTTSNSRILDRQKEKVLEGMIMILDLTIKVYHRDYRRNNNNSSSNDINSNNSITIISTINSTVINKRRK